MTSSVFENCILKLSGPYAIMSNSVLFTKSFSTYLLTHTNDVIIQNRYKLFYLIFQRLTPNTGIARFSLNVEESRISDFVCRSLHDADHLGQNGERVTPPKIFGDENDDEEKK